MSLTVDQSFADEFKERRLVDFPDKHIRERIAAPFFLHIGMKTVAKTH